MITKSITEKIVEVLSKEGCSEIYLFGSQVRGTATENSDIDIGVVGLSDSKFYSIHAYLEELLNKKIDFVELSALGSILHSYYNGLESIFLLINKNIDKSELIGQRWHRQLLDSMFESNLYRSEVLEERLKTELINYLGFRHFYRHSYGFEIVWGKIKPYVKA